jgi:hypothetical protein
MNQLKVELKEDDCQSDYYENTRCKVIDIANTTVNTNQATWFQVLF